MTLFLLLLTNLIPLYLIIAAGYAGGRLLKMDARTLACFAIYFCVPVVVFGFIADLDFRPAYILLPLVVYIVSAITAFGFLALGRRIYGDERANLLALLASMGNTGYFGLPVALLIFTKEQTGIYMFAMVGVTAFESTIGYYIAARGQFSVRDSLIKLSKFPSLYAVAAGLIVNALGYHPPEQFHTYWVHFKGAYVITGMMIIGAALAQVERFVLAPKFIALAFAGKFIAWPLLTVLFVALDQNFLHLFGPDIYRPLYLLAAAPFAANIAAYSAQMNLRPDKAAAVIIAGTVFALVFIPVVMGFLAIR